MPIITSFCFNIWLRQLLTKDHRIVMAAADTRATTPATIAMLPQAASAPTIPDMDDCDIYSDGDDCADDDDDDFYYVFEPFAGAEGKVMKLTVQQVIKMAANNDVFMGEAVETSDASTSDGQQVFRFHLPPEDAKLLCKEEDLTKDAGSSSMSTSDDVYMENEKTPVADMNQNAL